MNNKARQDNIICIYSAEWTVTGLAPESYEVLIFDWESDGSVSSTPSYGGHVNMTGPEPELLSSVSPTNHNTPRREMLLWPEVWYRFVVFVAWMNSWNAVKASCIP